MHVFPSKGEINTLSVKCFASEDQRALPWHSASPSHPGRQLPTLQMAFRGAKNSRGLPRTARAVAQPALPATSSPEMHLTEPITHAATLNEWDFIASIFLVLSLS